MNVKANKIDGANATIEAQITNEEVAANVDKIAKQLAKTANIPGFRKGKVPVSAVKKQYGERLVQDAEAEALREVLSAGLTEIGVANEALIGEPQISKFDKGEANIDVEVTVAIRPEIDLGDYKQLVPEFKKPKITAAAVKARIDELALAQAPFETVEEDRELVEGDTAMIDFEGFLDGVAFEGGKAEGFSLTLGSKQFIPGFEDQVIGMKKGEEKTIKVTFPENYGGKELAGKEAEFKVTVHEIQTKKKPRHDAKLAKQMLPGEEEATMDMLKEKIQQQLESEELTKLYNEELKPKMLETLVEKIDVDLPKFVVEQEMDMALNKKAQTMNEDEIKELQESAEKVQELREEFREEASRSVKATFIIDALAKAEGIEVAEQEVMQTIYFEAMQMGQDPAAVYKQYQESGYLPAIQMAMVEDKVLSKLLNDTVKEEA
ncbi:trigger factor [Sulfurimonas sp. HSL3-7]|uniref:trigger factor n=1 Tax=Sulfonitrofixus jiaomeiensis TaxID=3131938 RepID=UPI0031F75ECE